MQGVIQNYFPLKGFGFILVGFNKRIFFHVSNFGGPTVPTIGMRVEFDLGPGHNGRPDQAIKVIPAIDGGAA
jgi:cold shock CspA family protein